MRLTWKPQAWRLLTGLPMLCIPASPASVSPSGSLLLSAHVPHPLLTSWLPPLCFCPHIVLVCTRCRGCSRHHTAALLLILSLMRRRTLSPKDEDPLALPEGPHPWGSLWPGLPELKCPSLLQSGSGLEGTGVKHSCQDGSRTRDGQFPIGTLERGQPHTIRQPLILTKQAAKFFLAAP